MINADVGSDVGRLLARETAAYEAMWLVKGATFKTIADKFRGRTGVLPSEFVHAEELAAAFVRVRDELAKASLLERIGVCLHGLSNYPTALRDAQDPIELFYFLGDLDLVYTERRLAIIGSRDTSETGIKRARRLARTLVRKGFTIVSGLAKGVDTAAHTAAINEGGRTIAVIGTPITEYYPRENRELQDLISAEHLVISQVPLLRYAAQDYRANRLFFPERNATMSAIADGTVIVEASDKSGTLTQARAALFQGRKLFILDSCFEDPSLSWPRKFEELGAIRVSDVEHIIEALQ